MIALARALLFVKHRVPLAWVVVERTNTHLFRGLHAARVWGAAEQVIQEEARLQEQQGSGWTIRALRESDLDALHELLVGQPEDRVRYFRPHPFDRTALRRAWDDAAFLMFGVFVDSRLKGYFFLRCFWNRKCFVGRMLDASAEGRGIGRAMNRVMYETAWRAGFRCLSTVSKRNELVMRAHRKNPHMRVLEELADNYLLIEFVR